MTCPECTGTEWVQVRDRERPTYVVVRPCSRCLPAMHDKWTRGGFRPKWATQGKREEMGEAYALTMAKTLADARRVLETK